jgi:two-component system NtrC family sensor kinase
MLALWGPLRALFTSLSLRLFLWLTGLLVLAFAAYSYVSIRTTSEQWERTVLESAQNFSDLVQSSTHYSMLINRKEDVRQIIRTIAREAGVDGVRIYDKQGFIVVSGDPDDVGRQVDLEAEACVICHDEGAPPRSLPRGRLARIYRVQGGDEHRVLGLINPIENTPECSSAACHAHPSEQTILGVLDVKMSMAEADKRLDATRRQAFTAAAVIILLIGISSATFIYWTVRRPVHRLVEGSRRIARGDLTERIRINAGDEIGLLADAFNNMTRDLQQAREQILNGSRQLEQRVFEKTGELEKALSEIQELESRKSHYMMISAHQLRSPLATIKTSLQVLTADYVDPGSKRGQRILLGSMKRVDSLLAIVSDLLELAKIREGQANAPWARNVELTAMLQDVIGAAQPLAQRREVRLDCRVIEIVVLAWGVPADLRYALENIVDNAIRYSHPGGEVEIDLAVSGELAILTATDHGIGIPAELQRDVFLEFVRAPNAKRHAAQGTGLGLTIVREVVERHGGSVSFQSKLNRGTTLTATLALRQDPPPNARLGEAT